MILNDPDANVVIRAADARDAQARAHFALGGTRCCLCGVLLAGTQALCDHHGND